MHRTGQHVFEVLGCGCASNLQVGAGGVGAPLGARAFTLSPALWQNDAKDAEPDSHSDFKPVSHVQTTPDVKQYIEKCLTDHKVGFFETM